MCPFWSTWRRAARVRGASARRRASRRLAGDGVFWDRLRVSGRVCGATCAAPRKNRRRRIGASPSCRRRKLHHHTRRASERWAPATASGVPPTRSATRAAPSRRITGSQKVWLCSSAQQRGDAAPRGRRAGPAAWLQSKTTQQEIRVSWEDVLCEFGCARLSARWSYFVARQRRKDSRMTRTRVFGTSFWPLKWLPWLPSACRRAQGRSRGRSRKLA